MSLDENEISFKDKKQPDLFEKKCFPIAFSKKRGEE